MRIIHNSQLIYKRVNNEFKVERNIALSLQYKTQHFEIYQTHNVKRNRPNCLLLNGT